MDYYSSNYIDSYVGESYQTPYGRNYDIVPSQAIVAPSSHEFSNENFLEYYSIPYYGGYDPATNYSVIAYSASTYSEPKSFVYDLYNGSYSPEVVTRCRISYSVSESNDLDFEEYDTMPYDGGYDLAQTSQENSDESDRKPYNESKEAPANEDWQLVEYKIDHGQDEKPPGSDHGSGYDEGNSYEYEKITPQIPSGYGLEAMDLCEGIFGYWPCLAKYNKRGHDCQRVADYVAATSGMKLQIISLEAHIHMKKEWRVRKILGCLIFSDASN
ncbi:hypothetical protein QYF36_015803 [Acer negundo]|nr:hypothetical protein QYF36_015803 [Acer negundo]